MKLFYVVRYQGPTTTRWPASYKSLLVDPKGGFSYQKPLLICRNIIMKGCILHHCFKKVAEILFIIFINQVDPKFLRPTTAHDKLY